MGLRTPKTIPARTRSVFGRVVAPRTLLVLTLVALGAQWVHALSEFGGAPTSTLFGGWIYTAVGGLAGLTLLSAGARRGRGRGPWIILGLGLASKSMGDVLYSLVWKATSVPVPCASDGFWLAFYPCAYLALLVLVRGRIRAALAATRLDGIIGGVAVAAVMASATLPTAFAGSAGGGFWTRATEAAYPVGDLVLIGAVVSAIALAGWRVDRTLGILAAAMVAWVTADLMYLFSVTGQAADIADALVLTGAAGMAVAGVMDRAPRSGRGDDERGLFVPVGFGAAALAILVLGAELHFESVGLSLAAVALALVLARMALALRENRALLGESRQQATTDPLTGLGNRRRFKRDLPDLLADASEERPLALIMLDLNGFKAYNDAFGHATGDKLLAQLGAALASAVAGRGEAYRLGGDEFCVLAPCEDRDTAALTALCARALTARGEGFSITAAHGVVLLPCESPDATAALALADARMYQDKATTGRSTGSTVGRTSSPPCRRPGPRREPAGRRPCGASPSGPGPRPQ